MDLVGNNVWATSDPFHIDSAKKMAFYEEITFRTSSPNRYDVNLWNEFIISNSEAYKYVSWTIRLGDTVATHVPGKGHTLSFSNCCTNQHYPFKVPWWTGEVVSIYRILNHIDETAPPRPDESINIESNLPHRFHGKYILEIRWFYTPQDIPGGKIQFSNNHNLGMDATYPRQELLETDEVDDIPCSNLLSPVYVASQNDYSTTVTSSSLSSTLLQFYCIRGWSIHRKALLPIGAFENRHVRAMMYSKYLDRGSVARTRWEEYQIHLHNSVHRSRNTTITATTIPLSWTHQYHEAIQKLSLTDASANIQADGIALTGRESEQNQILHFLRSAIRSTNDPSSTEAHHTFSLFIAGAPGTGKTASARSMISRLRKEQANGLIPPFHFVSINGMEMRHPFEAYVRLWELVSTRKEKRSPGEAAARLEAFFGSSNKEDSDVDDEETFATRDEIAHSQSESSSHHSTRQRSAIVCLVDEIDYLVTNKQTVVYNLFDWPIRGFIAKSKAQLIILGISNTLNLPERLHPRVSSRLGRERCIFRAYNVDESINILKYRLIGTVSVLSKQFSVYAFCF